MGSFQLPFFKKKEEGSRFVYANDAPKNEAYPSNAMSNTKYNVFTFVPKNLWEQFSRAMNRYFLIIAFLQLEPSITPVNPLTTWLPVRGGQAARRGAGEGRGGLRGCNAHAARRVGVGCRRALGAPGAQQGLAGAAAEAAVRAGCRGRRLMA